MSSQAVMIHVTSCLLPVCCCFYILALCSMLNISIIRVCSSKWITRIGSATWDIFTNEYGYAMVIFASDMFLKISLFTLYSYVKNKGKLVTVHFLMEKLGLVMCFVFRFSSCIYGFFTVFRPIRSCDCYHGIEIIQLCRTCNFHCPSCAHLRFMDF